MRVNETINDALYELGVVDVTEEPRPEDTAFALRSLNRILNSFNTEGFMIPHPTTIIYDKMFWTNCEVEIRKSPPLVLTRSTPATYIDDNGIIQTAAIDELRYQDGEMLIEDESTNYIPHSEAYDSGDWIMENVAIGIDIIDGSDGITDVHLLQESTDTSKKIHQITHTVAHLFGRYAVSWKVNKGLGERNCFIRFGNDTEASKIAYYNINDAKPYAGNQGIRIKTSVREIANGWLIMTAVYTGVISDIHIGLADENFTEDYIGEGKGIYLQNVQVEDASAVTSFIPTDMAIETRAADNLDPEESRSISPYMGTGTDAAPIDTIDAQPPIDIQQVFFRDNTIEPVDYACTPMTGREYAQRAYKGYQGIPTKYYIRQNTPDSVILTFNAVPQNELRLAIIGKMPFRTDLEPMDDIQWGAGIEKMVMLRLAMAVANSYHLEIPTALAFRAREAENNVRAFNHQPRTIKSDIGLMKNRGRGRYNPARI